METNRDGIYYHDTAISLWRNLVRFVLYKVVTGQRILFHKHKSEWHHLIDFFYLIQFNVPFKIISLVQTSQSIGGVKREYPGITT